MATILVVDDEEDVVEIVRFRLERDGHTVISANDGLTGLASAVKNKPDLAILDVMMPGIDGFELLFQIKHESHTQRTPVILLTAKTDFPSILRGWNMDVDDYIAKPFDVNELAKKVATMLSR